MNILHDILNPPSKIDQLFRPAILYPCKDQFHKNLEIARVYTLIVTDLRELLSKMFYEENRTYILTSYEVDNKYEDNVLFVFTSILCELRLSVKQYCYYLELETDSDLTSRIGSYTFRKMLRIAYHRTMFEHTQFFIEDCINIETNMNDHYNYFKNTVANANEENAVVLVEDAVVE